MVRENEVVSRGKNMGFFETTMNVQPCLTLGHIIVSKIPAETQFIHFCHF